MGDSLSYGEVIETTDPVDEGMSGRRVQVRERDVGVRSRGQLGSNTAERSQFFVVDTEEEVVIFSGDKTTGDRHNPFREAQARAFGIRYGYVEAITADDPDYRCEATGVGLSESEACRVRCDTPLGAELGVDDLDADYVVVSPDAYREACAAVANGE